jgi:hypothetical protein
MCALVMAADEGRALLTGFLSGWQTFYPSKERQLQFLRCYLSHTLEGEDIDQEFLEGFQQVVDAFALSSHLYWAVWAVLQAR